MGEAFPRPRADEVVSFLAFHERGLGYPVHWFLRRLLNEWGPKLQHLNPTGVLHVAGFITICEAFLGMEPHVDLFWWIFTGRALSEGKPPRTAPVGDFALQKKPSPLGSYPTYSPCDSNRVWHGEWFYIRNPAEASFPSFTRKRPKRWES